MSWDRLSGPQCYNMGHNGHGIDMYGVIMNLMGNLHAGGHSDQGTLSPSTPGHSDRGTLSPSTPGHSDQGTLSPSTPGHSDRGTLSPSTPGHSDWGLSVLVNWDILTGDSQSSYTGTF